MNRPFDKLILFFLNGMDNLRWKLIYREYRQKYNVADSFRFNGEGTHLYGAGQINLGANSYIGRNSSIQASRDCSVSIGKNCSISHYFMVYTENLEAQNFSRSHKIKKGSVTIGDRCWIGAYVFVKEGVHIGDNVVIGAHSVVTKDIPNFTVAIGSPAKVVKKIDS